MRLLPLLLVILVASVGAEVIKPVAVELPKPIPPPTPPIEKPSKLKITPRFKHLGLKPGESESFDVKIRNPTDKDVKIEPKVVSFRETIDETWISFDKGAFTLRAKDSATVRITVSIPSDAEKGFYSCQIAFTNDSGGIYVNAIHLSVRVYIPPSVKISPRWISDFVEAGKTYEYKVKVKNKGEKTFSINPKVVQPEYGIVGEWLSDREISIISSSTVPPNSEVEVKIVVNVPSDVTGYVRGTVDLGIDDPGLDEWNRRVELNLNVYSVPKEPFVKVVKLENASKLTVKVSSEIFNVPIPMFKAKGEFEVNIFSPSGELKLRPKVIEKLVVTTGYGFSPPWEETDGIYKVVSTTKTEIYEIENPENGEWRIEVMPKGCFGFSLEVEIE